MDAVDPGPLLTEFLALVQPQAKNLELSLDLAGSSIEELPLILADRMRVKQVLLNLLMNAAKYNTSGSLVTVRCEVVNRGYLRFEVTDDGPGISPNKQVDLFKPFNRLGMESGEIPETGIGLTISSELIDLMGRAIGFMQPDGSGSTFWFEIAVVAEASVSEVARTVAPVSAGVVTLTGSAGRRSVLYIEDNPADMTLMEQIVGRLDGVEMLQAHTAELGVAMAQSERPDVVFMDLDNPVFDGIATLQTLRAGAETAHIPVIAISAANQPTDIENARQLGFNSYITKPIKIFTVLESVEAALDAAE
jgi:CheY-like chemotaxis protein